MRGVTEGLNIQTSKVTFLLTRPMRGVTHKES